MLQLSELVLLAKAPQQMFGVKLTQAKHQIIQKYQQAKHRIIQKYQQAKHRITKR